ncbi:MAG: AbrB/MazE/SpoVT family DNA-binding domain-containing protein [Methanobacteriota archaeon]|nr:MAG: AbrB/MazE/SpoVT family DNA-binding domain-containing protein [Euryarchaeota archaeon]
MTVADGVIPVKRCLWNNYIVYVDNPLDSIGPRFEWRRSEGMEGRKLQLTGGSTYVVSLPKRWVTDAGLKAGDTVFLEPQVDGAVSIRAHPAEKPLARRRVFEEKGEERRDHLLRKLIGAYIAGFGYIEIRFKPEAGPFVRRVARDFSRMVIGPEVIEESRNSVVIQDLSDTADLSAEKCLRRMHLIVRAMHEDALQALRTHDDALARDVAQRDQDVDRLYWMVAKQYNLAHTPGGSAPDSKGKEELHNYRLIAKLFERIGDHAERIARTYPVFGDRGLDPKLLKELEGARESAIAILDKAFFALLTADVDSANEAVDDLDRHQKLIDGLSHHVASRKGEELLALAAIVDSLARTAGYATDIAEIAIDVAVARVKETP